MKNKDYYMDEIKNVSKKMLKEDGFKFAIVADSHLDNSILDTICNIKSVDSFVDFECLIHLGDIMCGNLPRNITMEILTKQLKDFRSATKSQRFYPVQGNHDGYYEQRYNSVDTIFDDEWYSLIRFINDENNAKMVFDKPYYYIDYKKEKIRLIMLCDFRYDIFYDEKKYAKLSGIDDEQIEWLANDALNVGNDYTIMLFSHDIPFFINREENACFEKKVALQTLIRKREEKGFDVACWFVGHFHGEYQKSIENVNFVLIGSQTAYVPTLWDMPKGGYFAKRQIGTVNEDLWDACVLDKQKRLIKLIRFGAGIDREIHY